MYKEVKLFVNGIRVDLDLMISNIEIIEFLKVLFEGKDYGYEL